MNFGSPPNGEQEIHQLISRTPVGRSSLEKFMPYLSSKRVAIKAYPDFIVEKLREAVGPDQPIGACFVSEENTGTIYLDFKSPLGVLAPFLLHEICHCLDQGVWDAGKTGKTKTDRDQAMLKAETQAFDIQHRFVAELTERYPDYRKFLTTHYGKSKILCDKLSDVDVAELYGFKIAS